MIIGIHVIDLDIGAMRMLAKRHAHCTATVTVPQSEMSIDSNASSSVGAVVIIAIVTRSLMLRVLWKCVAFLTAN